MCIHTMSIHSIYLVSDLEVSDNGGPIYSARLQGVAIVARLITSNVNNPLCRQPGGDDANAGGRRTWECVGRLSSLARSAGMKKRGEAGEFEEKGARLVALSRHTLRPTQSRTLGQAC